jgi:scyllo-inositol 2-dehydrogenase (NADP+)
MTKIRTGLIGLGRIGWQYHLPELVRHENFELVAVMDPLHDRVLEAYNAYGVPGCQDVEEFFSSFQYDLVVIASPTLFHAEQSIKAFEHGCDVFCEKPFAMSYEEANLVAQSMHKHGRKFMIYQPQRTVPEFRVLQRILARDYVGQVYMIKRAVSDYDRRNDWQAFSKNGGGMLYNYGAHYLDQVMTLAKSKVAHVHSSLFKIATLGDAEDVVKVVLRTQDNTLLDVDINMATAFKFAPWYILGTYGTIEFYEDANEWHVRYFDPETLASKDVYRELAAKDRLYTDANEIVWNELRIPVNMSDAIDFYDECYKYFALDQQPFVPISESLELMRVLDLCKKCEVDGSRSVAHGTLPEN